MANAKIIIELRGVEAGSGECGECPLLVYPARSLFSPPACSFFTTNDDSGYYPFRCPACLAAEEEAKEKA